jgi:hypothetical protein
MAAAKAANRMIQVASAYLPHNGANRSVPRRAKRADADATKFVVEFTRLQVARDGA